MTGFDNLKIESPYKIVSIEEISMEHAINNHAVIKVNALLDEKSGFQTSINARIEDEVHVYSESSGKKHTIFRGIASKVKTSNENGIHRLELDAVSGSFRLDCAKKNRSFQKKKIGYSDIIGEITKKNHGAKQIMHIGKNKFVEGPLIQYEESDWQFLKRLSSNLNSVLVCDIMDKNPRFHFGFPDGQTHVLEGNVSYVAGKDLMAFKNAGGYGAGFHDTDFFYYQVETYEHYSLGDSIRFKNRDLRVSEVKMKSEKGLLKYSYRLSNPKSLHMKKIHNKALKGKSLEGRVIDTENESVKLHLDIDGKQKKEDAYWFPFAPDTASVMYCMPKKGTDARLYFPDGDEKKARVTSCIRTNGESCQKTGDPNVRYFGTEHGSEMELSPSSLNIVAGCKEPLKIAFDDKYGLTITSHRKLSLNSDGEVSLYTPKKIVIKAASQLFTKKALAMNGISIENEYHFLGSNVKANGTDSTSYPPFDDEPKQADPPKKSPFDWGKLARNVLAGLAVVAVVVVVAAATAATLGAAAPLVGAVAMGAGMSGITAVGIQAVSDIKRGEVSDVMDYVSVAGRESIIGAISGAIFGPFEAAKTLGAKMLFGGATNIFESCLRQMAENGRIDPWTLAWDGGIGMVTGGVFHGAGKVFGWASNKADDILVKPSWLKNAAKEIGESIDNNVNKITEFGNKFGKENLGAVQESIIKAGKEYGEKANFVTEVVDKYANKVEVPIKEAMEPVKEAVSEAFSDGIEKAKSLKRAMSQQDEAKLALAGIGDVDVNMPSTYDDLILEPTETQINYNKAIEERDAKCAVGGPEAETTLNRHVNEEMQPETRRLVDEATSETFSDATEKANMLKKETIQENKAKIAVGGPEDEITLNRYVNEELQPEPQKLVDEVEESSIEGANSEKVVKEEHGEKGYRQRIDEAEAIGDLKAANDARYERYCEKKKNEGKTPLVREEWDKLNNQIRKNRSRGYEQELVGRESLEKHLDRKLENNNTGNVETHTSCGNTTRPDSIGHNSAGEIDLIHDHKHLMGEGKQIVYDTDQMRTQRQMIEADDGCHVVTVSSDNPKLNEIPPQPRPSAPLAVKSVIYYTDVESGEITYIWELDSDLIGGGYWRKL